MGFEQLGLGVSIFKIYEKPYVLETLQTITFSLYADFATEMANSAVSVLSLVYYPKVPGSTDIQRSSLNI